MEETPVYTDEEGRLIMPSPTNAKQARRLHRMKETERLTIRDSTLSCWCGATLALDYFHDFDAMSAKLTAFHDAHENCPPPEPHEEEGHV